MNEVGYYTIKENETRQNYSKYKFLPGIFLKFDPHPEMDYEHFDFGGDPYQEPPVGN